MISFSMIHLPIVVLSSWIVCMWENKTTQSVSVVIVITMVKQNDIISNHALTYCHFVIMENMYVGKPNKTKGQACHCHHNG